MGEKEREAQEEAVLLLLPLAHAEGGWEADAPVESEAVGHALHALLSLALPLSGAVGDAEEQIDSAALLCEDTL